MGISRRLEPEAMDTADEAFVYDSMDHTSVNQQFVTDLLAFAPDLGHVLDLGTGTARIPIELCRRHPGVRVMAVDLAIQMLEVARINLELAGLTPRIQLGHADSKALEFPAGHFEWVISNSLIHHIPEPLLALGEAVRVTAPSGGLFFRDLMRPESETELADLVHAYTGVESEPARLMFADSLRAALSLEEIRAIVSGLGFDPQTVRASSDRHWTWTVHRTECRAEPSDS